MESKSCKPYISTSRTMGWYAFLLFISASLCFRFSFVYSSIETKHFLDLTANLYCSYDQVSGIQVCNTIMIQETKEQE